MTDFTMFLPFYGLYLLQPHIPSQRFGMVVNTLNFIDLTNKILYSSELLEQNKI